MVHEDPAQQAKTPTATPALVVTTVCVRPAAPAGEICRADDALAGLQRGDDVEFFVDVIAQRDDVDAVGAELVEEVLGDPAAAGDVLAVGDDQVDLALADERRELLVHHLPPGPADDVAEAQNTKRHVKPSIA